jgi:hypothetical protein
MNEFPIHPSLGTPERAALIRTLAAIIPRAERALALGDFDLAQTFFVGVQRYGAMLGEPLLVEMATTAIEFARVLGESWEADQ